MTAIAIWCNEENEGHPTLWAVSDSRVSGFNENKLIEDAVKIFTLSVIGRRPGEDGFFSEPYLAQTYGYCFAGNTLMGQNSYLSISPLLANIISANGYVPTLEDIAQYVLIYLKHTFDDFKALGPNTLFEAALFGHCPRNKRPEIFHFCTKIVDETFEVTMEGYRELKKHEFVYLGSCKDVLVEEITAAFLAESMPGRPSSRAPRYVIEEKIADEAFKTIGGDLQLAIADQFGCRPFTITKPYEVGKPPAYESYLGRELTYELKMVGNAAIAPISIA